MKYKRRFCIATPLVCHIEWNWAWNCAAANTHDVFTSRLVFCFIACV